MPSHGRIGLLFVASLSAAGCAQVFGLDETSAIPDPGVTLKMTRVAVGATVVTEPMNLATSSATFLVTDGAEPSGLRKLPANLLPPDTWQVDLPEGASNAIRYSFDGEAFVRHLVLPAKATQQSHVFLGKPRNDPAPAAAQISFSASSFTPAFTAQDQLFWFAAGAWSQRQLTGAELPGAGATTWSSPAIAYSSMPTLTGGPLERITTDDSTMILRYSGSQLVGRMQLPVFNMIDGANPLAAQMVAIDRDQTAAFTVDSTIGTRLSTPVPPFSAGLSLSWTINASPGASYGLTAGPRLLSGAVAPATGNVIINQNYGNPFAGWPSVLSWTASATRTYTVAGAPLTLTARMTNVLPPPTAVATAVGIPVSMPTLITVQGALLNNDGTTVSIDRAKSVNISFLADMPPADLFAITLNEVVVTGGVATLVPRFQSHGRQPSWTVPGDVFEAGTRYYSVRATCFAGGFPNLINGDLSQRQLPLASAFIDGPVFSVVTQ